MHRGSSPARHSGYLKERNLDCDYGSTDYWGKYYDSKNRDVAYSEWFDISFLELQQDILTQCIDEVKKDFKNQIEPKPSDDNKRNMYTQVIHLGCGGSMLGWDLYLHFDCGVKNIDSCEKIIEEMKRKVKEVETIMKPTQYCEWHSMNCTSLLYDDNSFHLAIDKGTFDSIKCSSRQEDISKYVSEVYRVLKVGGIWIIISHAPPKDRLQYMYNEHPQLGPVVKFNIKVKPIFSAASKSISLGWTNVDSSDIHYFAYICTKKD